MGSAAITNFPLSDYIAEQLAAKPPPENPTWQQLVRVWPQSGCQNKLIGQTVVALNNVAWDYVVLDILLWCTCCMLRSQDL